MAAARAALTAKYEWFLHLKPISEFAAIKGGGIEPRSQGCPMNKSIAAAIGKSAGKMIFLRPIGAFDSTPRRGQKLFAMALHRDALPKTLTVDWTFGGTWTLGPEIRRDAPTLSNEEIFCEVVRRRGSVAIYQAIPQNLLRVLTINVPDGAPSQWPELIKTDVGQVLQLD